VLLNLRSLSDDELLRRTESAASDVRTATTRLLHHLYEVQRRRLFIGLGFDSLFEYCVKSLHMSEPQAARRVNAARVLAELPHLEKQITDGNLSITALSQAHTFFKREAQAGNVLSSAKKTELFERLHSRPTREIERILLGQSSQPTHHLREKIRPITLAVTEIKFAADEASMADLDFLREFWAGELPNASFADLVKKMARFCRQELEQRPSTPAPEFKRDDAPPASSRRQTARSIRKGVKPTRPRQIPTHDTAQADSATPSVLRFVTPKFDGR
jgi:hypothetical protein